MPDHAHQKWQYQLTENSGVHLHVKKKIHPTFCF